MKSNLTLNPSSLSSLQGALVDYFCEPRYAVSQFFRGGSAMKRVLICLMVLTMAPSALAAGGGKRDDQVKRLNRASEVFNEIMGAPDKGIPSDLLDKSECIAVIPGLKKAGLGFGGKYGKGVVMCRKPERKNWTAPSFLTIEGGSFGLQIGVQQTDIVMLIMNRSGM